MFSSSKKLRKLYNEVLIRLERYDGDKSLESLPDSFHKLYNQFVFQFLMQIYKVKNNDFFHMSMAPTIGIYNKNERQELLMTYSKNVAELMKLMKTQRIQNGHLFD